MDIDKKLYLSHCVFVNSFDNLNIYDYFLHRDDISTNFTPFYISNANYNFLVILYLHTIKKN